MAGDANLGSLVAKLGLDTATLRNTIGEAKQHFAKLKLDTDQAASGISGAFQKSGAIAAGSILAIGVAAAAFSIKAAGAFTSVGMEVVKLQRYTGGTAEEMSRLRFAAQQSGVDTDKLTRSLGLMSKNLQSNKGDFDKFGIATVDARGKALPLNDVLLNVAARFHDMPNGAEKTAAAIKLFGRAGADLLPMLNKGRDGLLELERAAAKYGQVLTEKNIVAVKASVAAHREQAAAWQGLQLQIGAEVVPALTSLTKSFTEGLLAVTPAVTAVIRDGIAPAFSALASVVGGLSGFLAEHTNVAKGLAVVVGGLVVPSLTAWAVAQARVMAASIISFVTEAGAVLIDLAGALNLVTVSSESTAVGFTALNAATGAAFLGIGLIIAKIIGDNQKMQSSAKETAAAITKGAESPQAAIDQLRAKQAEYHREMGGGVNVLGLHVRLTDEQAKKAATAAAGYNATTAELKKLTDATKATDDTAGQLEESFTKQGLAVHGLGGATALTKDQIEELAASMKIDLSKATDEQKVALEDQARRLGITSVAALKLADDNKILGDWTKTAADKATALNDALATLIGTMVGSDRADIAYRDSLDKLTKSLLDNGTTLDVTTEKGRANKGAILDVVDATLRQVDADQKAGGTMEQQRAIIEAHVADLRKVLAAAGLTTQQVEALIAQYNLTPQKIDTVVSLTDHASDGLNRIVGLMRTIGGSQAISQTAGGQDIIRFGAHASGKIVTRPELSLTGEAGPEAILPLSNPARMRQLIQEAGIGNLFDGGYTPGAGQRVEQHNHVHLEAPVDAGIVRQVEYAGRVLGWQLDPSGRL